MMHDSPGRKSIGVGRRQPVIILSVSLRAVSSFPVCLLRHHAGAAYSAVL